MLAYKMLIAVFVVGCVASEPPRFRLNSKFQRFRGPARQIEATNQHEGYSYPKPTDSYGPPLDTPPTDLPAQEIDVSETEPQAENIRFQRLRSQQQKTKKGKLQTFTQQQQQILPVQPTFLVQYPGNIFPQTQFVYVF